MKFKLLILISCCLLAAGCTHVKYGEFEIEAVNTTAGVSAGISKDGELLILEKGDERQAIYLTPNRMGPVKLFNCQEAPLLYAGVTFFGKKGISILRIELPPKNAQLKFYRHREIGTNATFHGKKAWIMELKDVSPTGKKLWVTFEVPGIQGRKTGTFDPSINEITVVE